MTLVSEFRLHFILCLLAVLLWFSDACYLMFVGSSVVVLWCLLPYVCWQFCCGSLMHVTLCLLAVLLWFSDACYLVFVGSSVVVR